MVPKFNLDKIRFATDPATFEKAVGLYEGGKVTQFEEDVVGYLAVVLGTHPYRVYVHASQYDRGACDCYLGENNTLCKHMVAVAIHAVMRGKKLDKTEKESIDGPKCSDQSGELSGTELEEAKKEITSAMKYIKPYNGPSRIWFAYQNSLSEGCNRLSAIISNFPVSKQTADLLVSLLLRLDKKLCTGGVDDSDGTVGGFIEEVVTILEEYAKLDSGCIKSFEKLCEQATCFGWEESLIKIFDEDEI